MTKVEEALATMENMLEKPVHVKKRVRASSAERVATLKKSWPQRPQNPARREESLHR